jgi:hypothetical protein
MLSLIRGPSKYDCDSGCGKIMTEPGFVAWLCHASGQKGSSTAIGGHLARVIKDYISTVSQLIIGSCEVKTRVRISDKKDLYLAFIFAHKKEPT